MDTLETYQATPEIMERCRLKLNRNGSRATRLVCMHGLVASRPRMHLPIRANATLHTMTQRSENSDRLGQRHVTLDGPTV
jgi:hypothetical protein